MKGVVAAGHPLTAEAGAAVLRAGGNAVDAAVAAMLTSWVTEPLLTGPGAGGYLLVAGGGETPALLDFFVEAPGRGRREANPAPLDLLPVDVDFGDTVQRFHAGAASAGTWGNPAGAWEAVRRWGSVPFAQLAAPAAALARDGVVLNEQQGYLVDLLLGILTSTPECAELFAPDGRPLRAGDRFAAPELGDAIDRLAADGPRPFYEGDVGTAIREWLEARGGWVTHDDLAAYEPVVREPVRAAYRGRTVLTNPPPNAGGVLIALALGLLERDTAGVPDSVAIVDAMQQAQAARTPAFVDGLVDEGFAAGFLASRLGSTTHISVLDAEGRACSVTCTNGEGSGIVVPGTGVHVNNIMGEADLSPGGFGLHAPGRRMPSMMAPTVVLDGDAVELVVGSAGSNRIRSAILQAVVGVVDRGLGAQAAIDAPRVHFEDDRVYAEPGVDVDALVAAGRDVLAFGAPSLFFGGVQAVHRDPATGALEGGGDPRRGGAVAVA